MEKIKLKNSIMTSLIDKNIESDSSMQHKLLVNKMGSKIITAIIEELNRCDEFIFSVAFITKSGVSLLLPTLEKLEKNGVKGKILTGSYLNFTDPKAVDRLAKFKNIDVKLITEENLHAKGFFFKNQDNWNVVLGSSNLTSAALTKTQEWNLRLTSSKNGNLVSEILTEFNRLWDKTESISSVLEQYTFTYRTELKRNTLKNQLYKEHMKSKHNNLVEFSEPIKPNLMQKNALKNLNDLRENREDKALIISATGTGKTILSAFDVNRFEAKKVLFIVHRENIARKSLKTYMQMINDRSFGVLTGSEKDFDADYVFTTIQTLNKHKHNFKPDEFDYIIIDEVHHGGAKTYQEVYSYFKPKFSLGMTATPQRTDGFDIFSMYDNNIAFEYNLSDALSEELLCPFHYFGVSDVTIDDELIDEKTAILKLTSKERTDHIIEKIKFYGHDGDKVHGLIFVSRKEEAKILSNNLNDSGYKTVALTGEDSEEMRQKAISNLEKGSIDYIITVDIFNEGIDIPCVNQVLLLRPTQSAIVYIQQIGRGLRKVKNKNFVVIIDFIGNYKNNYLIPVAIGNDNTYDKDKLKKDVILGGTDILYGESVIQFEEIVQKRLLKQITSTNFSTMTNIKRDYEYLKLKFNRIPSLEDFIDNELISPVVILSSSIKYYAQFVEKVEKIEIPFDDNQKLYLEYLSKINFPITRIHEIRILELIIKNKILAKNELYDILERENLSIDVIDNAISHLSRNIFLSLSDERKYIPFIYNEDNKIYITEHFENALNDVKFLKELNDIINTSKKIFDKEKYANETLTIGKLYDRKTAYKNTLHDYNNGYQVSGYNSFGNDVLVFITLDDSSAFTSYDNALIDNETLTWYSKSPRRLFRKNNELTLEGKIANNICNLDIFVKRSSSENFYYLGKVKDVAEYFETKTKENKDVIKYTLKLENRIEDHLFKYLSTKE